MNADISQLFLHTRVTENNERQNLAYIKLFIPYIPGWNLIDKNMMNSLCWTLPFILVSIQGKSVFFISAATH